MSELSSTIPLLLFILSASALMNAIGLYLLHKDRRRQTNQNLILKFLSGNEFFASIVIICRWALIFHGTSEESRILQIISMIMYGIYFNYTSVMLFMTFDRFIASKFPFRFPYILSKRKAKIILLSSVVTCAAIACASLLVDYVRYKFYVNTYAFPVMSTFTTLSIILTYGYIFMKILRQRHCRSSHDNAPGRRNMDSQRFLKMAAVITMTYMLCYLVPDILFAFFYDFLTNLNANIFYITWYCGLLLDPITYIFLQKRLRNRLLEILCLRNCHRNTHSTRDCSVTGDGAWVVETKL